MTMLEELEKNGSNISDGLNRLMNNKAIYEKLLHKLPDSINQNPVLTFIDSADIDTAINNAHTLKGVTGNLAITPLYTAYTEIVALLRANEVEKARAVYLETVPVQENIVSIINKY